MKQQQQQQQQQVLLSQVHPAFQTQTKVRRYPQQLIPTFNPATTSPMFYGYTTQVSANKPSKI
jgi:hypothetical protein